MTFEILERDYGIDLDALARDQNRVLTDDQKREIRNKIDERAALLQENIDLIKEKEKKCLNKKIIKYVILLMVEFYMHLCC